MNFNVHTPLLASIVTLLTAVVVFRKDAAFKINRRFSYLCIALAVWNFSYFGEAALALTDAQRLLWSKVSHVAGFFGLSIALHFMIRFTRNTRVFYKRILALSYAVSSSFSVLLIFTDLVIAGVVAYPSGFHAVWGPLYPIYMAHLFFNYLLMLFLLVSALRNTSSHIERNRIRYVLFGSLLVILTTITNFLPAMGVRGTPTLGFLGTLLFMVLVLLGIYKYRLMNIRLALMQYLILTLFWLVMAACYFGLVMAAETLFHAGNTLLTHMVIVGLFVILFWLCMRSLLPAAEKLVYPLRSDLKRMLFSFERESLKSLDGADVARALFSVTGGMLKVPSAALYLKNGRSGDFELLESSGAEKGRYPGRFEAGFRIASVTDALVREEIRRDLELENYSIFRAGELKILVEEMEALRSEVLLPLSAEGETLGFLCFSKKRFGGVYDTGDISALKLLSGRAASDMLAVERIRKLKEKESLALIGQMTAGIAHEIKNPLGAIKGAADSLRLSVGGDDSKRFLSIIIEESSRLDRIVREFLYFARPLSPAPEETDMAVLTRRCRELFLSESGADRFTLAVEEGTSKASCRIDPDLYKQVFFNLAKNSLEADPAGSLSVRFSVSGKQARVVFSDTCGGMPEAARENLFVPFHTTKAKGTGLGLAIVKKLVSLMNGDIYISSQEGRGTDVILQAPCA